MKVIFLDIDGVLNNHDTLGLDRYIPTKIIDGQRILDHLSPWCMWQLNDIIKETGAKVVISSAWRSAGSVNWFQEVFESYGFEGEVIDKTPVLYKERGIEIQKWLDDNKCLNIESFVILDDDSDMLHLLRYLVKTENEYGLRRKHIKKAVKVLNNEKLFIVYNLIARKCRRVYGYLMWKYKNIWKY